jgi:hypothetical protein
MRSDPPEPLVYIGDKIIVQLVIRGWTEQEIRVAVSRAPIGHSVDNTGGRSDPATVYGSRFGGYIVVNNITSHVVQISDKTDPGWVPDSRIDWI